MTFKHSGDLGDIIWSLPAVRALGGGHLYLDPDGGRSEPLVNNGLLFLGGRGAEGRMRHTKLCHESIAAITPVLLAQSYITSVTAWTGESVDANLDAFRIYLTEDCTLVRAHCEAMVVREPLLDDPWMSCRDLVNLERPILLSRSLRYHGNDEFWVGLNPDIQERACFVGMLYEYEVFTRTFPRINVPFYETPTLMDLFVTVASCGRLISNQGLAHAFAEALKKPLTLEVYRGARRCIFARPDTIYV